jgi:Tol biopolymer transport system component
MLAALAALFVAASLAAPYDVARAVPAPELFAEGVVSTPDDESGGAFSPDGTEFYFVKTPPYTIAPRLGAICVSRFANGAWQKPEIVPFSGRYLDLPPHLSPDGATMYFASSRPLPGSAARGLRIWAAQRAGAGWSEPTPLPAPVNDDRSWSIDPSVTRDGTLYFASNRSDERGHFHIFRARRTLAGYETPVALGPEINSPFNDLQPFVAPDESLLLFASAGTFDVPGDKRAEELIAAGNPYPREDLYLARNRNGSWTRAEHLGHDSNSPAADTYPSLTPDGRYLFFSSERSVFTVPAPHLITGEEFVREASGTLNGHGNVYFIDAATALGEGDPPGAATPQAELIGPDVISTPLDEFGGAISPDGASIYFDRSAPPHYLYTLWVAHRSAGGWAAPQMLPFSGRYRDSDPVLSPDGATLLFASDRPAGGADPRAYAIWAARATPRGWSEPQRLPGPVNAEGSQVFASMAADGDLYFSSNRGGGGTYQVYRTRLVRGVYQPAEKLGAAIDPEGSYTADVFIAPDRAYMLLGVYGARDGYGSYDLYISYRNGEAWSYPINLGPAVNTPAREYSPRVTPDGKYLVFTSERGFGTERLERPLTYDELEAGLHSVFNGLGNIYRIEMRYVLATTRGKARFP